MKRYSAIICTLLLLTATCMQAQNIVSYQYWYDNNIAATSTVNVSAAPDVQIITTIPAASLSTGLHTVTIRFLDSNGNYSSPYTAWFAKSGGSLVQLQYWFDNNYSVATTTNIGPGLSVNLNTTIATGSLGPGPHSVTLRVADADGNYSSPVYYLFIKGDGNLVEYEYWFDGNYSVNTNTLVQISPPAKNYTIDNVNTSTLTLGQHLLAVHVKDQYGNWSVPWVDTFNVIPTGINEVSLIQDVSVFPNPTTGPVNIAISTSSPDNMSLKLVDMTGNTVVTIPAQQIDGSYNYQYDMSHLSAGVYFWIVNDGAKSVVRKVVKQ